MEETVLKSAGTVVLGDMVRDPRDSWWYPVTNMKRKSDGDAIEVTLANGYEFRLHKGDSLLTAPAPPAPDRALDWMTGNSTSVPSDSRAFLEISESGQWFAYQTDAEGYLIDGFPKLREEPFATLAEAQAWVEARVQKHSPQKGVSAKQYVVAFGIEDINRRASAGWRAVGFCMSGVVETALMESP